MTELSDSLLKKIKDSENSAIEKCRKIALYEQDIGNLERRCQEELEEEIGLKSKLENSKQEVLEKKIEKSRMMLEWKATVKSYRKIKSMLRSGRKQRIQVLQEITDFMDTCAKTTLQVKSRFGFAAEEEELALRLGKIQDNVSHLNFDVKTHFSKLHERETNSREMIEVTKKLELEKKALNISKELSVNLEAESNELMIQLDKSDSTEIIQQLEEDIRNLLKKVSEVQQDANVSAGQDTETETSETADMAPSTPVKLPNKLPNIAEQKSMLRHLNSPRTKFTLPQPPKPVGIQSSPNISKPKVPSPQLQRPCPSSPRPRASSSEPPRPGTPIKQERKRQSVEVVSNGSRFIFKKPLPPPPRK